MALDIYVGPLCRYYTGNWQTLGRQYAEQQGLRYTEIRASGDEVGDISEPEGRELAAAWQKEILDALADHPRRPLSWEERSDLPYVTHRPGFDGLWGLALKYAYLLRPDLSAPAEVPVIDDILKDPAYLSASENVALFKVLVECELWLPGDFTYMFPMEALSGNPILIGPLGLLGELLDDYRRLEGESKATAPAPKSRFRQFADKFQRGNSKSQEGVNLNDAARVGYEAYSEMTLRAIEWGLPMILDY